MTLCYSCLCENHTFVSVFHGLPPLGPLRGLFGGKGLQQARDGRADRLALFPVKGEADGGLRDVQAQRLSWFITQDNALLADTPIQGRNGGRLEKMLQQPSRADCHTPGQSVI